MVWTRTKLALCERRKAALSALGFKDDLMRHGIQREVFICQLANNATRIMQTGKGQPDLTSLLSAKDIAEQAVERWIIPRSRRRLGVS